MIGVPKKITYVNWWGGGILPDVFVDTQKTLPYVMKGPKDHPA